MLWGFDLSKDLGSLGSDDRLTVILVRHGRSTFNDQGRYQGSSDESVLTPQGERMAQLTGLYLSQIPLQISALYGSPLRRVQQTAIPIKAAIDPTLDIQLHEHLTEIDLAQWQGLTYQQVKQLFPSEYRCWQETPHLFELPSSDKRSSPDRPVEILFRRAREFWEQILNRSWQSRDCLLVISHSGTNRALISTAIGLGAENYHRLQQSNCGISILQFHPDRQPHSKLRVMNSTQHLGEILPKLKAGKQGLRLLLLPQEICPDQRSHILHQLRSSTLDFTINPSTSALTLLSRKLELDHAQDLPHFLVHRFSRWDPTDLPQDRVITGLVIAPHTLLASLMTCCLGPDFPLGSAITLDGLSLIHYPDLDQPSILQGVNLYRDLQTGRSNSPLELACQTTI